MAVENNSIIRKMMSELQQAKDQLSNQEAMIKHIANVRLLCDLMIEEDVLTVTQSGKMKQMIEKRQINRTSNQQLNEGIETMEHGEANGNSIFDF